jgi:uncharacterized membrane protein
MKNKDAVLVWYLAGLTIFAVNFVFKLINIGAPSFWYDEIISVHDTFLEFGHIKHESEWDKNPPFYYYCLWIWSKAFGISEIGIRSMSAFFSSVTAVLIFYFVRKRTDWKMALIITLIFTVHPFLYYYAQEGRCYGLLIFIVVLNLMTLYSFIRNPVWIFAFLLGLLNFLIFYTHYVAGLILFPQFIFLILCFRKNWKQLLLIYLLPLLLILIRFTKKQYKVIFLSGKMSQEKNNVSFSSIESFLESLNNLYVSHWVFLLITIVIVYYTYRSLRYRNLNLQTETLFRLFVLWTPLICIVTLYVLGKFTNVFDGRYLIFCVPYIFIGVSFLNIPKYAFYGVCAFFIIFSIPKLEFGKSKMMDYKFAAILAHRLHEENNAQILVQTHDVITLFTYYYDRSLFTRKDAKSKSLLETYDIYYVDNFADLSRTPLIQDKPVIFFQTFEKQDDAKQIAKYFGEKGYKHFYSGQIEGVRFSYFFR